MRPAEIHSCSKLLRAASFLLLLLIAGNASAAGPRWVTGSPYFGPVPAGRPVVWSTTQLSYSTDAGDLSASVNHAAADAIVAAAASIWNVPTSAIVLAHGGTLVEDVSSANTSISNGQPAFPTDAQATNYAAVPIAVVYDSDGAITDMLLGQGSSDPNQCRQNGVTERVDSITPFGAIQHALLILNGRCSGPAPEQQLQLQYQLGRAFGRVLGLAWSQVNDNVFTDPRNATDNQKLHWPIMHPIDLVCGEYTYQCLPQPFTLRDDDIASISALYPVTSPAPRDKVLTWQNAARINGTISFPTGEGMQGVNIVVRRGSQDYQETSSVSGFLFQQNGGNSITGAASGIAASQGSTDPQLQGYYDLAWVPEIDAPNGSMSAVVTTEPINPLYIGPYTVGPYVPGQVAPSGSAQSSTTTAAVYDGTHAAVVNFAPSDAASSCTTSDGTETAPKAMPASGIWTGLLCGHGHTAWSSVTLAANRTATIEVAALDESGAPTTDKAMPLIGAWSLSDLPGSFPTLGATESAFNTIAFGISAAQVFTSQATDVRFAIADARGDGRPDFLYRARVLYGQSVQPATISLSGGQITIAGTGFTTGLQVRINGTAAPILQTTPTSLIVTAPAAQFAAAVDIAITDAVTGGTSAMYSALTYSTTAQPNRILLISAPAGTVTVGSAATAPFTARIVQPDGITPVAGTAVTFSVTAGAAQLNACGASSCTVVTDSFGNASTNVTPTAAGSILLQAAITGATQSATFTAAIRTLTTMRATEYVAAGESVTWPTQVVAAENTVPAPNVSVTWTGNAALSFAPAMTTTNSSGLAPSAATTSGLSVGTIATGQACAWITVCTSITAVAVGAPTWRVQLVSGGGQSIASTGTFSPVVVRIVDTSGHAIAGAPVAIHQTITAAALPCPTRGACPIAPTLDSSVTSATSDADGLVSITPMQLPGTAGKTNIVVATGTQGFLQLTLEAQP